jgi:hypothetical protein
MACYRDIFALLLIIDKNDEVPYSGSSPASYYFFLPRPILLSAETCQICEI